MTTAFFKIVDWIISALIGIFVVKSIPYVQNYATKNYSSYRDRLYKEAASRYTQKTSLMTHTLLTNLFSLILILITFFLFAQIASTKREFYTLIEPANSISKEDLASQIATLKNKFVYLDIGKYLVAIFTGLSVIIMIWREKRNIAINHIINDFENRITILAPEVSDKQILSLRRQWTLMVSYSDYITINKEIDILNKQNSVMPESS